MYSGLFNSLGMKFTPGSIYPDIHSEKKGGITVAGAAVTAGAVVAGAKIVSDVSKKLGETDSVDSSKKA